MAVTARLTQGPVGLGLLRLTLPMILGISASIVAGIIEAFYLGHLGTLPLAAYSFTFPVTGGLMSISLGISIGVSSVLARAVGGGDASEVRRLATDGIGLIALVMLCVSGIGWLTMAWLFSSLGADERTLPMVLDYMLVWYASLVFMAVPAAGANALRATGDASISGIIMVAGSVLQVLIGPFLIFGWLGLPRLELQGAAVANLLARILICMVTLYVLVYREHLLDLSRVAFSKVLNSWRRILAVGLPAMATNLIGPVSTAVVVSLLADFSQETVAGYGIAARLEGLFVIPLFALSASIGPFVGQNWGSSEYGRANQAMKLSFIYSIVWGLLVAVLLWWCGGLLASFFDDDPEVVRVASLYLMVLPVSYGTWGVLMMASATFNSLGKPLAATTMSVVRMLVLYVPLAFLGKAYFGLIGIFAAGCIANLVLGSAGFLWNRREYGRLA